MEVPSIDQFRALEKLVGVLEKDIKKLMSTPPLPEWVSVSQAAEMLNRAPDTVRIMVKRGDLVYKKGLRKIEITSESIRQYNLKHTIK